MTQFFSELAKWDTLNGDESVSATMNAGSAFMLSFMGQQDKAEQITDVLMYVMNFIEPFQKYLSPFGAIGVISSVFGAEIDEGDSGLSNIFNILSNGIEGGCQQAWDLISGSDSPISQYLSSNIGSASLNLPSIQSVKNFYSELDLNNPFLEGIIDFLPDGADETNTVGDGLLFFFGFSAIAMAFSPAGEIAATFTLQGLSILFNIIGIATQGWTSAMMGYGSMVTGFLSEVAFHASTNQVNPASLLILAISPTIGLSIGALRTAQVIGDE